MHIRTCEVTEFRGISYHKIFSQAITMSTSKEARWLFLYRVHSAGYASNILKYEEKTVEKSVDMHLVGRK